MWNIVNSAVVRLILFTEYAKIIKLLGCDRALFLVFAMFNGLCLRLINILVVMKNLLPPSRLHKNLSSRETAKASAV